MRKQFWPSSYRGQGQAGGTAGERVSAGYFARGAPLWPCRAHDEGERVTDIQQVVPSARSAGRGFHAYSAKHLDMLTARAGLTPDERLAVRAVATVLPFRTNSYVI